jgi:hypothetical protein
MSDERGRRIAASYRRMAKILAEGGDPVGARQMERDADRWEGPNPPAPTPSTEHSLVEIASTLQRIEALLHVLIAAMKGP